MSWEQGVAIISIMISFISIGVTLYNSFKQREIDEKLQRNEFEYSRRKIWYDNQSQSIEEVLQILSNINHELSIVEESFSNAWMVEEEYLSSAMGKSEKLARFYNAKQVYFDNEIKMLIKKYLSIMDDISDRSFHFIAYKEDENFDPDWVIKQINISEKIYHELIEKINEEYLSQ